MLRHSVSHRHPVEGMAFNTTENSDSSIFAHFGVAIGCSVLQCAASYCSVRQRIAVTGTMELHAPSQRIQTQPKDRRDCLFSRCAPVNCESLHCNTLQHTAMHCNTLQRTATYCATLFSRCAPVHCVAVCCNLVYCSVLQHAESAACLALAASSPRIQM